MVTRKLIYLATTGESPVHALQMSNVNTKVINENNTDVTVTILSMNRS